MLITGIEIQNFRGIRNLSILELDQHTNLFVGKNGAGKSSLLDAISNVMSWFVARMLSNTGRGKDIPVNDISLHAKEGSTIRLQLDGGEWCTLYRSTEMKKNGSEKQSGKEKKVYPDRSAGNRGCDGVFRRDRSDY